MRKLYKEGKECVADTDQVQLMLKAGWSTSPEKAISEPEVKKVAKVVKEVIEQPEEESDESDVPKKVRSRKIKKIEPKE